ncbi:DUF952 domain-containing protein [Pseudomonas sp. CGJS7]|uniref:DUF952 domain-containing protein n=1 Tax=Pseudomonas sp. CGJS7 TaxID=3109348 RepID=UPI00300B3CFD
MAFALAAGLGPNAIAAEDIVPPDVAYKILTRPQMEKLEADGRFEGSQQDAADGYIHLSTEQQLNRTADSHFSGNTDLFVASVNVKAAGEKIRWETSPRSGLIFPHLYGVLDRCLVMSLAPLRRDDRGRVVLDARSEPSADSGRGSGARGCAPTGE